MMSEDGIIMSARKSPRLSTVFHRFYISGCIIALLSGLFSGPVQAVVGRVSADGNQPVQLAAGRMHSAMILQDGALFLWGDNTYGQLGPGGSDYLDSPRRVDLPAKAVAVSLGSDHTLILTEDGSVYTMGRNTFGQLGNGSTLPSDGPAKVEGLPPVQSIAAGSWHSLAVCRDGSVWGWGDNSTWQLGETQGDAIKDATGNTIGYRHTKPVKIVLSGAVDVAAGAQFSLYLRHDGQLFAWGDNSRGQLGDGTVQTRSRPTAVVGLSGVRQVSAGYQHVLSIAAENGHDALFVWGDHSAGQLGLADIPAGDSVQALPRRIDVTGDTNPANDRIALISAGYAHSIAIVSALTARGLVDDNRQQVLVWGDNSYGQLGLGHTRPKAVPQAIHSSFNGFSGDDYLPFSAVAAGGFHMLLMSSKGLLAACGRGDRGQLGTQSVINRYVLSSVRISDLIRPGWQDSASLSMVRNDAGLVELRWPAAQDNIGVAGYRVMLHWSDGTAYVADIGMRQHWVLDDQAFLAGKEDLAVQAGLYVFDAAGRNLEWQLLSRLVGFLAPPDDPEATADDYFTDLKSQIALIDADQHQWRPTATGILQPLEAPWDVRSIYGAGALPDPPTYLFFKGLAVTAMILYLAALVVLIRSRRLARRRKHVKMASLPVAVRHL
jgi:alpha-tubulin suppressor-like RCC1 family protein